MSTVVTLRVEDRAAEAIKKIAHREKRSLSQVGAQALEEWTRMEQFPFIEFRAFSGQRLACIKGRLPVWEVIMIATDYDRDADKVASHLQLRPEQVKSALNYYAAYSAEIDELLQENRAGLSRLQRLFPNLEVHTVKAD